MDHRELEDRALLTLARDGSAPAFAVLVYRHLPRVDHLVAGDADLLKARTKVFARAMRKLNEATEPFGEWIEDLAASTLSVTLPSGGAPETEEAASEHGADSLGTPADVDADSPTATPADVDADAPTGTPADVDTLWRELAPRWPNGRRPVHVPTIVGWLATLVVTIALSAAVPWITLGQFDNDEAIPALRAFPIDADIGVATPDEDEEEADEPEPLPTYEFPVPPEEDVESDADTTPSDATNDEPAANGDENSEADTEDGTSEADAEDGPSEAGTPANSGGGGGGG